MGDSADATAATVTAAVSTSGKEFEGRRVLLRGATEGVQTLTGQVVSTRRVLDKGFTSSPLSEKNF